MPYGERFIPKVFRSVWCPRHIKEHNESDEIEKVVGKYNLLTSIYDGSKAKVRENLIDNISKNCEMELEELEVVGQSMEIKGNKYIIKIDVKNNSETKTYRNVFVRMRIDGGTDGVTNEKNIKPNSTVTLECEEDIGVYQREWFFVTQIEYREY